MQDEKRKLRIDAPVQAMAMTLAEAAVRMALSGSQETDAGADTATNTAGQDKFRKRSRQMALQTLNKVADAVAQFDALMAGYADDLRKAAIADLKDSGMSTAELAAMAHFPGVGYCGAFNGALGLERGVMTLDCRTPYIVPSNGQPHHVAVYRLERVITVRRWVSEDGQMQAEVIE